MIHQAKGRHHEHEHAARHETGFRVMARRNRLLGVWAAEALGLPADERDTYAREVVAADLELPGDEDVIRKVLADFETRNVVLTRDELIKKLHEFGAEARSQFESA
ncbi:MAG: DUF1476 domain-containing protein [Rhodospirillales bacterium]